MIKVSVILPVYNVEKYIEKCINSLINQTLKDLEFIFVDDCSSDNSIKILEKYAETDPRIKIIHNEKNSGSGVSRNFGIEKASGEYLSFIDPDDWIDLDYYEKLYTKAKEKDYNIVKTKRVKISKDKNIPQGLLNKTIEEDYSKFPLYHLFTFEHQTAIYKTSFIKENNITYGLSKRGQDTTFLLKTAYYTDDITLIDGTYYYYYINDNSMTQKKDISYYCDYLRTLEEKIDFLSSVVTNENRKDIYNYSLTQVLSVYNLLINKLYLDKSKKQYRKDIYKKFYDIVLSLDKIQDIKTLKSEPCIQEIKLFEGFDAFILQLRKNAVKDFLKEMFFIGNVFQEGHKQKVFKFLGHTFYLSKNK